MALVADQFLIIPRSERRGRWCTLVRWANGTSEMFSQQNIRLCMRESLCNAFSLTASIIVHWLLPECERAVKNGLWIRWKEKINCPL
jgi:hypothetical protein